MISTSCVAVRSVHLFVVARLRPRDAWLLLSAWLCGWYVLQGLAVACFLERCGRVDAVPTLPSPHPYEHPSPPSPVITNDVFAGFLPSPTLPLSTVHTGQSFRASLTPHSPSPPPPQRNLAAAPCRTSASRRGYSCKSCPSLLPSTTTSPTPPRY